MVANLKSWQPSIEVTDHLGMALLDDVVFFASPPGEIGKVSTAHSTLRAGKQPWPAPLRFIITVVPASLVGVAVFRFNKFVLESPTNTTPMIVALLFAAAVWGLMSWMTWFRHTCTYTGSEGVARFKLSGNLDRIPKKDVLVFDLAAELRAKQTQQYVNGVYAGTEYQFVWTDAAGNKLLKLAGSYRSRKGTPKPKDPYYFAQAAEGAWNAHLGRRLQSELDQNGYVQFAVNKNEHIRVGPGYLEIAMRNISERLAVEDIKTLSINEGMFHIHHKDAKWLGRKGKWSFEYGKLGNAQMFLLSLQTLLGFRFGE